MFRGRYQLGDFVTLGLVTLDGSQTYSAPTAVPYADIYSASAKVIAGLKIPVIDKPILTGQFQYLQPLDGRFTTGNYQVVYHYTIGSYEGLVIDTFEVVAGGNADGAIHSMAWFEKPGASYVVQGLDSRKLVKNRNPRV